MRKTSVRKFIHMVIDILPLLIIPIFALNILHKETEPISIEVQENKEVNFNQIVNVVEMNNGATSLVLEDNEIIITIIQGGNRWTPITSYTNFYANHKYAYVPTFVSDNTTNSYVSIDNFNLNFTTPQIITPTSDINTRIAFISGGGTITNAKAEFYLYITDLTYMYGVGNEPTIQEFLNVFDENYYQYTLSKKVLVPDVTTTYNDTDIGSQFVYALYKPVHDYFNFNNFFNMGAIYNWIELNLFSGTSPLPIFIIWNVIVYEFFVDLIFLLYGVFMFIIDFAEKCLERPFRR